MLLASLLGFAAVAHQSAALAFGVVDGLPDPALDQRPASIVGVNVALEQYADLEQAFGWLQPFPWLRQTFAWDQIEPQAGSYDWQASDRIIPGRQRTRPQPYSRVGHDAEWARAAGGDLTAPPASAADFARFAAAFASRYGTQIDVYQIWDEPNILLGWGGRAAFGRRVCRTAPGGLYGHPCRRPDRHRCSGRPGPHHRDRPRQPERPAIPAAVVRPGRRQILRRGCRQAVRLLHRPRRPAGRGRPC